MSKELGYWLESKLGGRAGDRDQTTTRQAKVTSNVSLSVRGMQSLQPGNDVVLLLLQKDQVTSRVGPGKKDVTNTSR